MEKKCDFCPKIDKIKHLKKINGNLMCKNCYEKKLKKRRERLEKELGITEEQKLEEEKEIKYNYNAKYKEKRTGYLPKRRKKKIKEEIMPEIKGSKIKKKSNKLHFYLTKTEKEILYRKYTTRKENRLSPREAYKKIKDCSKHLSELVIKLKEKKISKEEISNRFKEEFARTIEKECL